jgi:hypothetical protein
VTVLVAAATGNGRAALIAFASSYALTLLAMNDTISSTRGISWRLHSSDVVTIFMYGVFVSVGSGLGAALLMLVRAAAVEAAGAEAAGGAILALDLSLKVLQTIGLAANLLVLQRAIRAMEHEGPAAGAQKAAFQMALMYSIVLPACIGLLLLQKPISSIVVPPDYLSAFQENVLWATLVAGVLTFRMFAIDTIFIISGRSVLTVVGPALTLSVAAILVPTIGYADGFSARSVFAATSIAAILGTIAAAMMARRALNFCWPIVDMLKTTLAASIMASVILYSPQANSMGSLLMLIVLGATVYIASIFMFNLCGLRTGFFVILNRAISR